MSPIALFDTIHEFTVLFQLTFTYAFGFKLKSQFILLFSLFLLLFICPIALFGTIHESYCTIFTNFYIYLQYFQNKFFNFSKINEFQTENCAPQQANSRVIVPFLFC